MSRGPARPRHRTAARVLLLATLVAAGNHAIAETRAGYETYIAECSKCHGLAEARTQDTQPRLVAALDLGVRTDAANHQRLAVALPYGPSLRGIIGRPAGTVDGFDYSKAFLEAMHGTTWNAATIDAYIADSQLMTPGARMFYRQPDSEIRRQVIEFLSGFE